ncbi:MAG TPA: elongation factor Ts, partial [Verrucomicrobia bacterium]|nr:elongation factor Ts [Verrucomicrobiota bacterium]
MAEISASLVKELREETGVGMMECKKALVQANGDKAAAIKILRESGMAIAAKKATRAAKQGVIAADIAADAQSGLMIEVNCET